MEVRGRRCREIISPEREKTRVQVQQQQQGMGRGRVIKPPPTFKKVQVVYYLSKNGQLEHPHFMEVTHLAHQHLRLKDVMDRLTVLRGRSMPSLYSWSYKRSYKNGYVWNDLAENDDIISPSEGAEYVLKGSELIDNCTEKIQHPQYQAVLQDPTSFQPKGKLVPPKRLPEPEEFHNRNRYEHEDENGNQEEEEDFEEKTSYTAPNTPYSRCSIGVSTDEIELELERQEDHKTTHKNQSTELSLENSPPSATSSTISDKVTHDTSKRFEDGDPVGNESLLLSRNSVLYNLIACGGSVSFRGKSKIPALKEQEVARKSSSSSSHRGRVLFRSAAAAAEEEDEIKCMSENPRFGNLQAQEKEYFSGSIVEAISEDERVKGEAAAAAAAGLKKSSSYNEERSSKGGLGLGLGLGLGEDQEEEVKRKEKGVKGKCISISKKNSSSSSSSSCFSSLI